VRVDFGRLDVFVPQKRLNRSEVGPSLQKVTCKGMPKEMRVKRIIFRPKESKPLDHLPNRLPTHGFPSRPQKERVGAALEE
jgi:hypothetical protein